MGDRVFAAAGIGNGGSRLGHGQPGREVLLVASGERQAGCEVHGVPALDAYLAKGSFSMPMCGAPR